jgi:transposase
VERERRYPSDLTDAQWGIVEPMLPLIKSPGRIPKHPRRAVVDATLYVVRSGCSWRQLPVDFPPWQTVWGSQTRLVR